MRTAAAEVGAAHMELIPRFAEGKLAGGDGIIDRIEHVQVADYRPIADSISSSA